MRIRTAVAVVALAMAGISPAAAQSAPDPFGKSLIYTITKAWSRQQPVLPAAVSTVITPVLQAALIACGTGAGWMCVANYLKVPLGSRVGTRPNCDFFSNAPECGGTGYGSGGAGASGEWAGLECENLLFQLDPQGNLIIPALKLSTGGVLTPGFNVAGAGMPNPTWVTLVGSVDYHSATYLGMIALGGHTKNQTYGTSAEWWTGCYQWVSNGCNASRPAFYAPNGTIVSRFATALGGSGARANSMTSRVGEPCTPGTNTANYGRYTSGSSTPLSCLQIELNLPTPTGLAIGPVAALNASQWRNFPSGIAEDYNFCPLSISFIRQMAQRIWEEAAKLPEYDGPPPSQISDEDVTYDGGDPPITEDLKDAPNVNVDPADEPVPLPPDPVATPPAAGGGSTPTTYDPNVGVPELSTPDIDFWPDLPTITLSLGNPACPTYDVSVPQFGWNDLTLDSHCGIIEANRLAIGAIALLMFTLGGILIVLRA